MSSEWMLLLLLIAITGGLLSGYPVAFVLAGISLLVALLGSELGIFDMAYIEALPSRIYGVMNNDLLISVPLFIFMGVMLERSKIAEELLTTMGRLFGNIHSGLGISVMIVGALLAASTGIVGATVVTMGMISLPAMMKAGYSPRIATGSICAAGTLGQIIPPSIVLILLGDQISNAYQTTQMALGNLSPKPVSIADLFVGAIIPGLLLVLSYTVWIMVYCRVNPPQSTDQRQDLSSISWIQLLKTTLPPLLLIVIVLGSILSGIATATESASVGAVGAIILAGLRKKINWPNLKYVMDQTIGNTCMVFTILIGATVFTLVFRGYGGDDIVHNFLDSLPGGFFMAMLITMLLMFFLGFFLDFIEITFVVVPIVAPILLTMGADPIWLAIMIAINLQTSFLTPPFGFSLFYLRGVAPDTIKTTCIYRGVIPFVAIQLLMLLVLSFFPDLTTWLPEMVYGEQNEAITLENDTVTEENLLIPIEDDVGF